MKIRVNNYETLQRMKRELADYQARWAFLSPARETESAKVLARQIREKEAAIKHFANAIGVRA